jgi:uncharacterized protein
MSTTTTPTLEALAGQKTVILTSYRRDGTAVDTPVNIAFDGGRAFIRTYEKAFKTKRLRRHPEAELWQASNGSAPALVALARPRAARRVGAPIHVRARELSGDDYRRAAAALARKYPILHGFLIPRGHRLQGTRTINLELTPVS